ncbi:MAG: hypothetical protein Q9165_000711 [Trypethelium subeluteriae]
MDFLKSAVVSAIQKSSSFPYIVGDRVDIDQSLWTLNNGTKRVRQSPSRRFGDSNPDGRKTGRGAAYSHSMSIPTEAGLPWREIQSENCERLGTLKTIKFINDEATSVHGAIKTSSIFASESGEWKLGGFDVLSSMKDDDAVIYAYGSLLPDSTRYAAPEVAKGGWEAIKRSPIYTVDSYDFGILIFEVFNGGFSGGDQIGQTKNVPPSMHSSYKRLLNPNPKVRLSVSNFLEQGRRHGGFFETPLIHLTEGIENLGLKDETEREEFLNQLDGVQDDFPEEFFKMKVLPELLKSVEFGGGGPKVFRVVMNISTKLSEEEFDTQITPVVVRLFASPDRAMRVCLLDNLPLIIDHLSQKLVSDKIFPQMVTGFTDVAPLVREQTVKAILTVIGKLSDRVINGELLRYLAKTANDEQPGIRTNTTICLGKIAKNLGNNRVRKYGSTLPDTVQPPATSSSTSGSIPRMSTPQNDTTWAGWAISSFTNKLSSAQGEINPTATTSTNGHPSSRPQAPRTMSDQTSSTLTASQSRSTTTKPTSPSPLHRQTLSSPTETDLMSSSTPSVAEDFNEPWGDDFGASAAGAGEDPDEFNGAWGDDANDSFAQPAAKPTTATATFDDKGEPDFAGWLNAQAQAKTKKKNPLPKGLGKSATTGRPIVGGRSNTTGAVVDTKKAAVVNGTSVAGAAKAIKPVPVKKLEQAKEEADDEEWGDAWE